MPQQRPEVVLIVGVALLGILMTFSFHKIDEGHVGVYYRVCRAQQ